MLENESFKRKKLNKNALTAIIVGPSLVLIVIIIVLFIKLYRNKTGQVTEEAQSEDVKLRLQSEDNRELNNDIETNRDAQILMRDQCSPTESGLIPDGRFTAQTNTTEGLNAMLSIEKQKRK